MTYRHELSKQLRPAATKLNMQRHRVRRFRATAGVVDGAQLAQRSSATAQIRLGVAEVEER